MTMMTTGPRQSQTIPHNQAGPAQKPFNARAARSSPALDDTIPLIINRTLTGWSSRYDTPAVNLKQVCLHTVPLTDNRKWQGKFGNLLIPQGPVQNNDRSSSVFLSATPRLQGLSWRLRWKALEHKIFRRISKHCLLTESDRNFWRPDELQNVSREPPNTFWLPPQITDCFQDIINNNCLFFF